MQGIAAKFPPLFLQKKDGVRDETLKKCMKKKSKG